MDDRTEMTVRAQSLLRYGAYELSREIGRGGMGSVWEARHVTLQRRVAVKILHAEFAQNPELLARFLLEGVAAARVEHPNVAAVIDVGHDGDRAWLVMEYLDGEDLGAVLDREPRLDPTRAVDIALPVLAALGVAHREGVVHRDLKPGNIVLARDKNGAVAPKIIDFGFSKIQAPETEDDMALTRVGMALGTLSYMPLEQVRSSRSAGPACDQYAVAVTLYRCLTGELPFAGRNQQETFAALVRGTCRRPSEVVPALPPGLDDVVLRAMQRLPEARFASVTDFGAALLPYASPAARVRWAESFGATPPSAAPSLPPPSAVTTLPPPPRVTTPPPPRPLAGWMVAAFALVTLIALCELAVLAMLAARV